MKIVQQSFPAIICVSLAVSSTSELVSDTNSSLPLWACLLEPQEEYMHMGSYQKLLPDQL